MILPFFMQLLSCSMILRKLYGQWTQCGMDTVQCPIDRVCLVKLTLFQCSSLTTFSPASLPLEPSSWFALSFSIPFDNELLFLWIITLWSLKIFFRDSLLMLLFYSLPLRSRTSGDIRLLLGIFLTFEKCPRNCSKTGISQVFDLWPCEEQHPGGFGKRSGDPHSLNLNNF